MVSNKYNIYKIQLEKFSEVMSFLEGREMKAGPKKEVGGCQVQMYYSDNPEPKPPKWLGVYLDFLPDDLALLNCMHYAVLFVFKEGEYLYAFSMGKASFYLQRFCDIDFGINLAERILDPDSLKMKSSKTFGGLINKRIVSYYGSFGLDVASGEALQYVKGEARDKEVWGGSTISFAVSVSISMRKTPSEMVEFVSVIEKALREPGEIEIPRLHKVKDQEIIDAQDLLLISKLEECLQELSLEENSSDSQQSGFSGVQGEDVSINGIDFVFLDGSEMEVKFLKKGTGGKKGRWFQSEILPNSLMGDVLRFVKEHKIDLRKDFDKIKISRLINGKACPRPVKFFLDFVIESAAEDRSFCLKDGSWYQFSKVYLDILRREVDALPFKRKGDLDYGPFKIWESQQKKNDNKVNYAERFYLEKLAETDEFILLDRENSYFKGLKIERADLMDKAGLYFVKVGVPQKLHYAIDQSIATLRYIKDGGKKINFENSYFEIKKLVVWFVFDRKSDLKSISEVKSFIFLIKLSDWARLCREYGFEPVVYYSYKRGFPEKKKENEN